MALLMLAFSAVLVVAGRNMHRWIERTTRLQIEREQLIDRLLAEPDLCVGDNEPYSGHLPGDAIDRHALTPGRHNTLIEIRNDLIGTEAEQRAWAARLAPILTQVLAGL